MRKRLVLAVVAMSLMFALSLRYAAGPATAQTDLDAARQAVADTTERLEGLLAELESTQRRGDELAQRYWQVQSGLEKLGLDVQDNEAALAELDDQIDGLRDEVRIIAVDRYVASNEYVGMVDHASQADRAAAEALARLVVGADNEAIDRLAVVEDRHERLLADLEAQRLEQAATLADVEATQGQINNELSRLGTLRSEVATELAELQDSLAVLERAEAERQAEAAEAARIAEERARAEAAAAAAAEQARLAPTPAPQPPPEPTPTPQPTAVPNPQPSGPQPSEPFPTATPEDPVAGSDIGSADPEATSQPTGVPNPQPSEPFPTATPEPTEVPNPQPSEPFPTATPEPTAVPNPQPSEPVASGGGIVCPLAGPFTHTDDFNSPRAVGGIHRANDLISDMGTPVLAVASGELTHKESSVGGLSAHLKGDNGDYYFYTHLSGYENVGAGHVQAGTVIGYVGETGNAPIPHLHFEIHSGGYGNYTNPYGPVRAACF